MKGLQKMQMKFSELLRKFIQSEPKSDKHIYFDNKNWCVTQEWLCGAFAGVTFCGPTIEDALNQEIEYLNKHIGHNSIVGNCVTASGWPDLQKVKSWLDSNCADEMENGDV